MASYNVPIELLSYLGAQYIYHPFRERKEGESEEEYRKNGCHTGIFIPDVLNGIKVEKDNRMEPYKNPSGCTATLRVNLYPVKDDDKYVNAVKKGLASDGKDVTRFNIPSHEVKPSYTKDYYERMRPLFIRKAELLRPDLKGQTPETSDEMRRLMHTFTPYRLGYAWQIEPKESVQPTPMVTSAGYYAPQVQAPESVEPSPWMEQDNDDYLPF